MAYEITNLQNRAEAISQQTGIGSITPEIIGKLMADTH